MTAPEILGKISQEHPRWNLYYYEYCFQFLKKMFLFASINAP